MGFRVHGILQALLIRILVDRSWQRCVRAGDPTCWVQSGFTEQDCCGGLRVDCWDHSYTFERCCGAASTKGVPPPPPLALGITASRPLAVLRSCWPGKSASASYERCCALHHGARGNDDCWERGLTFQHCCLPAVAEGLDDCDSSSGSWCNTARVGLIDSGIVDHRAYVGRGWGQDYWYVVGKEELDFLVEIAQIQPSTRVLDLGCGSLRLGRLLIPFLQPGGYLGLDKSRRLLEAGWFVELDDLARARAPQLGVSDRFEFRDLFDGQRPPEVSVAFSLLTHLNSTDIVSLLGKLRKFTAAARTPHRLYATLRVKLEHSDEPLEERGSASNSHGVFVYTTDGLRRMAVDLGWRVEFPTYSGTQFARWGGGRKQQMVLFQAI